LIRTHSYSEAGGHPVNEDVFLVQPHPADAELWLCALADGMGGQAGGGRAARLACQIALDLAARLAPRVVTNPAAWPTLLGQADQAVARDAEAGYTTLIGFAVSATAISGASSGDSAVLALSPPGRAQRLTAHQIKNPPTGSGGAVFVPFAARLESPWMALAMTDGVWKYVGWERIVQLAAASSGEALLAALQQAARLPGSGLFQDDFTAVLFEG
jgi:hypothetical protein